MSLDFMWPEYRNAIYAPLPQPTPIRRVVLHTPKMRDYDMRFRAPFHGGSINEAMSTLMLDVK